MKKNSVEKAAKLIPDLLQEFSKYFKESKNELLHSVSTSTGTIGTIVKIFGKPLIDKYFKKVDADKLKDFGHSVYLQSSLVQIGESLHVELSEIEISYSIDGLLLMFENLLNNEVEKSKKVDWVIFFQPKYHPVVSEVLRLVENFLLNIHVNVNRVNAFKRNFYENIEKQIGNSFGEDLYRKHLAEIEDYMLQENEAEFLHENLKLSKIGFKENENLMYEETFAEWKPVGSLFDPWHNGDVKLELIKKREWELVKVENLIDEYFEADPGSHLEKILFIVADFGKGKSVFFKQYTAVLSRKYLLLKSEYVPVYFNLRNYKDYPDDHRFGVLGAYLEIRFGININEEYFQKKRYVFLVDSLDECGELVAANIDKVISSIKKIQNLNPSLYKFNRIIVTSRPFDDGLKKHLENHKPYIMPNKEKRQVEYFISLYGFKISQFNNWLFNSLKGLAHLEEIKAEGFNREILNAVISNDRAYDIYSTFIEKKIISTSELRRPIFSYMILQLIANSINFETEGKIGVYLSFLNLLTKDAKYLHDVSYKINIREQFEARNILHATAAVWIYNKSSSNKTEIKKADICRALNGEMIDEYDPNVLKKFKDSQLTDIEFLSHSYFGENNNVIHFQHQSFAEILLAEYYLKVLLKYSLDEDAEFEQARIKLTIGDPTLQTIEFLKELVSLLSTSINENAFEKRRLLFPLLASLATRGNNKTLYCNYLHYEWYNKCKFEENSVVYPSDALTYWPVKQKEIDKILQLCRKIINSENSLTLQRGTFKSSLFKDEVFISPQRNAILNVDKWIALLCGNILVNNPDKDLWFNGTIEKSHKILELLTFNADRITWGLKYFQGLYFSGFFNLSKINLAGINFSNSYLVGIDFDSADLYRANFKNCTLVDCNFIHANLRYADFENVKISGYHSFALAFVSQGCLFPHRLAELAEMREGQMLDEEIHGSEVKHHAGIYANYGQPKLYIGIMNEDSDLYELSNFFAKLLRNGYQRGIWSQKEIINAFGFESKEMKAEFIANLKECLNE